MSWIANWEREFRKDKIFILGGRAGTSLVHKCLLVTGLTNWGTWSLHDYSSEPEIFKHNLYNHYPNITEEMIRLEYPFEIAKCPDFGFVIDLLERTYPNSKYIIMKRDITEAVESHIRAWGNYVKLTWKEYPNWERQLAMNAGGYPQHIKSLLIGYTKWREREEKKSLDNIPFKRKLFIEFDNLMDDFQLCMMRISRFVDVPYNHYRAIWLEMRKIKLMHTASDVKNYINK